MSIEWDSLILGVNELKTVGPATENARRANSVRTRGTNSRGAPAERIGLVGAATVNMLRRIPQLKRRLYVTNTERACSL